MVRAAARARGGDDANAAADCDVTMGDHRRLSRVDVR